MFISYAICQPPHQRGFDKSEPMSDARNSQCFQLDIQKWQNQLFFDGIPDDSCHFIALSIHRLMKLRGNTNAARKLTRTSTTTPALIFWDILMRLEKSHESTAKEKSNYQNLSQSQLNAIQNLRGLIGLPILLCGKKIRQKIMWTLVLTENQFFLATQEKHQQTHKATPSVKTIITVTQWINFG